MSKLWAQITGALPDDAGSTDAGLDDAGGQDLGFGLDLADDADETAAVTAKIAAARQLAAQDLELTEIPPTCASTPPRCSPSGAGSSTPSTQPTCPADSQETLMPLLASPGGVSTRQAAAALGCSHMTVSRQFHSSGQEGVAEVRGQASGRRWHLTSRAAAQRGPVLHAVPGLNEGTGSGDPR